MTAVPYRGSVPAFTDVIGGRLDAMIDTATSAIPRIRNGQLRRARGVVAGALSADAGHADDAGNRARHQADVVAGPGGAAANASRLSSIGSTAKSGAHSNCPTSSNGWRRPGCWPRRPRPKSCSVGSRPRSSFIRRSRRSTPSRPTKRRHRRSAATSLTGVLAIPTIHQPASSENDMKLMYFDDYKLGVVKGDAVVDVSSVVKNIAAYRPARPDQRRDRALCRVPAATGGSGSARQGRTACRREDPPAAAEAGQYRLHGRELHGRRHAHRARTDQRLPQVTQRGDRSRGHDGVAGRSRHASSRARRRSRWSSASGRKTSKPPTP